MSKVSTEQVSGSLPSVTCTTATCHVTAFWLPGADADTRMSEVVSHYLQLGRLAADGLRAEVGLCRDAAACVIAICGAGQPHDSDNTLLCCSSHSRLQASLHVFSQCGRSARKHVGLPSLVLSFPVY